MFSIKIYENFDNLYSLTEYWSLMSSYIIYIPGLIFTRSDYISRTILVLEDQ